jgi:hypothetical protein
MSRNNRAARWNERPTGKTNADEILAPGHASLGRPTKIAIARACAAAALLREAEETRSAAKARFLAELAFINLTRAAALVEPHYITDEEQEPDAVDLVAVVN